MKMAEYTVEIFLVALLLAAITLIFVLLYKIKLLINERDSALIKQESDSKVLFLKSRYASMGETVGNIAHQWKQPLNAIGAIQNSIKAALIFQGEISKEKLLNSVDTSFKLLQHLGSTIDIFYRFLSHQRNENMSFLITDALETIRKITEYSFENSNIKLLFALDANPTIQGDANEFTHAMLNLILNAKDAFDSKYADSPAITVRVTGNETICSIYVADNAGGIRMEPLEMVFDLHITSKENGSGLGLFMTKNIIENRFGGTISVENKNNGACFTITLPYAQYGEHYSHSETSDEKLSLERINQLSRKVIELEEIEKTLKKWADIFKNAHWAIAMHAEKSNTFELTNAAFNALYGYSPQELRDISVPDLFTPQTLPILSTIQKEAFEKGYVTFESIHKRKDGSTFPVSVELIVIRGDDDQVLYHIANIWDLSEKKAAEERLLLKKFALDNINDAVFLIDENANFHYVNEGACTALGYTKGELLTMGVSDLDLNFPIEQWKIHWKDIKEQKTTLTITQHQRKDGTIFPIEISSNYFEYNGIGYSLAVSRDITERLLLEVEKETRALKTIAENVPDNIARWDCEGRYLYINPVQERLLGVKAADVFGMRLNEAFPEIDFSAIDEAISQVIRTGEPIQCLRQLVPAENGTMDIHEINLVPERDENGTIISVLGVGRDMTNIYRLQDELAKREQELRSLADTSPGMMGAYHMRPDGSVCMPYASPNIYEIFGITPDEIKEDATSLMAQHHPDDAEMVVRTIKESAQNMSLWHIEYRIIHPTKGIRWMEGNTMPQPHPEGGIVWYGYVHDITERKELEAVLQKERKFLIDAQRVAHTGSWYLDIQNGGLSWSNETYRIFELDKEQIDDLHKTFYERVHPDDREMVNAPFVESIKTRLPYEIEHRIVMGDGRIKYVIERCEHTYDNEGRPLSSIGTVQDITERKAAEEALKANRNLLHAILESSPGVITFALDKNYRYIAFDSKHAQVMRTIFGIEIAMGMNILEAVIADSDREIAKRSFDRTLLGESFIAEEEYGDERLSRNYWQIFYAPIYWENGEIMGLTCFNIDITERRRAEEKIQNLNTTLEKRVIERTAQLQEVVTTLHKEITERKEAEKQLKLVESAVNSSTEAIYINAPDLSILYVNDGACRMLGYTREELTTMRIVDIDANFSAEQIFEIREDTVDNKQAIFETKHRTKDGSIIDVEIVGNPFIYEGIEAVISVVKEITERKKLEKTMHVREQYQRTLLDNFPYFVWLKDQDSRLLAANLQYARVAKVESTADLEGKTDFDFFPRVLAQKYVDDDQTVMREGLTKNVEEQYADEHGQIHWMETWKSPVWVNGHIVGTVGCSRDITERKKTAEALYESEQRYKEIFENTSDSIYLMDVTEDGRFRNIAANPAFVRSIGIPLEMLIGSYVGDLTDEKDTTTVIAKYRRCIEAGVPTEVNLPVGKKTFCSTLIPIKDERGRVYRIIGLAKDITEARK